jgi:drug/metabolite transporter (DMT)-like permease
MEALGLGLVAAFAWGVHDILVRYVSRNVGIVLSLFLVLAFGALAWTVFALGLGRLNSVNSTVVLLSIAAGFAFTLACIGHYNAFARGPVRIVAPLIGVYSVVAFAWAAATGVSVSFLQWVAVVGLVAGIGLVSRRGGAQVEDYDLKLVVGFCLMAIVGFSATFVIGQAAASQGDHMSASLITRLTTLVIVGVIMLVLWMQGRARVMIPTPRQLVTLAAMGVLDATALGVVLAAGALPNAQFATAASSIFGLVTVLLAWLFLRESVNRTQWAGVLMLFASIAYLSAS